MSIEPGIKRLAIGATLALLLVGGFVKVNSVRSQMISLEVGISTQYVVNQNQLSSYVLGYSEQVGIADRQAQQLRVILTDAVKGRYDGKVNAQGQPALYSAIKEAYPKVDLATYDKIIVFIQANREAFRGQQQILLDKVRNYKSFRNGDIIDSLLVGVLGFPSNQLTAKVEGQTLYGDAALNKIEQIVIDDTTRTSFSTGSMKPLTATPAQ
jgi:hypothetical protein